jgi:hypothetical protein
LSDWENDRYGIPDSPNLMKIAKTLKISVDDLISGVDDVYDAVLHAARTTTVAKLEREKKGEGVTSSDRDPEVQQDLPRLGGPVDAADPAPTRSRHADPAKVDAEVLVIEAIERDLVKKLDAAADTVRSVADALRIARDAAAARGDAAGRAGSRPAVRKTATGRGGAKR